MSAVSCGALNHLHVIIHKATLVSLTELHSSKKVWEVNVLDSFRLSQQQISKNSTNLRPFLCFIVIAHDCTAVFLGMHTLMKEIFNFNVIKLNVINVICYSTIRAFIP